MLIGLTGRAARANISKHFYRNVASSANSLPSLTLYTGDDCQLCDVAKATLDEIRRDIDFDLKEYNIRDDTLPEIDRWRHAYQYDIPVLHLEGKEIARHRLNKVEVRSKILEALSRATPQ